jgi:DNA-binding transcriptional ArsR family regulator
MRAHSADAARLLRALANAQRLEILCALAEGEMSVSELNVRVDLSQSALSQHLAVLRSEGIVDTRREAQTIFYSMHQGPAASVMETLHGIFCGGGSRR